MFIHFFCLCPLGLATKLNFNISKEAYSEWPICSRKYPDKGNFNPKFGAMPLKGNEKEFPYLHKSLQTRIQVPWRKVIAHLVQQRVQRKTQDMKLKKWSHINSLHISAPFLLLPSHIHRFSQNNYETFIFKYVLKHIKRLGLILQNHKLSVITLTWYPLVSELLSSFSTNEKYWVPRETAIFASVSRTASRTSRALLLSV